MSKELLIYKGKPLVRYEDTVYYGNMTDKYVIVINITDYKDIKDTKIPSKATVSLQYTDPEISNKDKIVKSSEKNGLYAALDIGAIWLERALAGK